jgi:hypothetical protein
MLKICLVIKRWQSPNCMGLFNNAVNYSASGQMVGCLVIGELERMLKELVVAKCRHLDGQETTKKFIRIVW